LSLTIGGDVKSVVLVISGTTPVTREKAVYELKLEK